MNSVNILTGRCSGHAAPVREGRSANVAPRRCAARRDPQSVVCSGTSRTHDSFDSSAKRRSPSPVRATTTSVPRAPARETYPPTTRPLRTEAPDIEYDAIVIGGGMGGLAAAARLVEAGASVLVLEKYLIPGGSAGHFKREGYTFDVGSSMMFGFGDKGGTNLMTRALASVGKKLNTIPDPSQVQYHLPKSDAHPEGLNVTVWREYEDFLANLKAAFPHEAEGIRRLYDECWTVFNALNALELKSLEEPRYLMQQFFRHPLACLTLAWYSTANTGEIARRYIKDPELLRFIDIECFIFSTVMADMTPLINGAMVFCDRHYGGINYPVGGVGRIAEAMADGIEELGGHVVYKANVKRILKDGDGPDSRARGVQLADGRTFRAKTVISNATRWDTFENMLGTHDDTMPEPEVQFRERYIKSPSFVSLHMGVEASVLEGEEHCHHIILEDWADMEKPGGTLFVSCPTLLDPSLAPPGRHIVHAFTPDWVGSWKDLSELEYAAKKEAFTDRLVQRLDAVFPGLAKNIVFMEVGTPRTHRRFLNRVDGTYGPIPSRKPLGMLTMPFNTTAVPGLYCAGDSTFPGQGVNAVVFSGFGCAHRILCDLGREPSWPVADRLLRRLLGSLRQL